MKYSQAKQCIEEIGRDDFDVLLENFDEKIIVDAIDQNEIDVLLENLCDDCGDIPKDLPNYIHIDWTSTASDIMMDYSEDNGHYFRNY